MGKFAKLYERNGSQVLVKIDSDGKGNPEVRFFYEPKDLGVCSMAISFRDDSPEMWDRAEGIFEKVTQESAFKTVEVALEKVGASL